MWPGIYGTFIKTTSNDAIDSKGLWGSHLSVGTYKDSFNVQGWQDSDMYVHTKSSTWVGRQ